MFFKWKKDAAEEPICFHRWKLADLETHDIDSGYGSDIVSVLTIGCVVCGKSRTTNDVEYRRLEIAGLVEV